MDLDKKNQQSGNTHDGNSSIANVSACLRQVCLLSGTDGSITRPSVRNAENGIIFARGSRMWISIFLYMKVD